jgi:hypothetical protein
MKKLILLLLTLSSVGFKQTFAQITPRSLEAKRTTKTVIIDGKLNDIAWQDAAQANDYTEFRPTAGRKEEKGNHTETFLMYDDAGIYFGGTCFERNVDSIAKELVGRDGFGTNDYIGLIFDTYNDKLNDIQPK